MIKKVIVLLMMLSAVLQAAAFSVTVALPEKPGKYETLAAKELTEFLRKASVKVTQLAPGKVPDVKKNVIWLGWNSFSLANISEKPADFGKEEYLIRKIGNNLVVTGGKPVGTLYGVYALLNRLGIYFIAWDEVAVPKLELTTLPDINERKAPAFAGRQLFNRYPNRFRDYKGIKADKGFWQFYLRNFFNGITPDFNHKVLYTGDNVRRSSRVKYIHNFYDYIKIDLFKTHPEYFSMDKRGKRNPNPFGRSTQLCLSNPEVVKLLSANLLAVIRADRKGLPQEDWPVYYNITPNDASRNICCCADCKAVVVAEGCETGILFRFTNQVAEIVCKEFPDVKLQTQAGLDNDIVPKTKLHKNVTALYCDNFIDSSCFVPLTEERAKAIARWSQVCGGDLMVWDYWNMGLGTYFNPPRPEVVCDAVISDVRRFKKLNVNSLFVEAERDFIISQNFIDMEYFLLGQLAFDPSQDAEKLISVFINNYYGAAAPYMRNYLDVLRAGVKQQKKMQTACFAVKWDFLTPEFAYANYKLMQKAIRAVGRSKKHYIRVAVECVPLYFSILYYWRSNEEYFAKNNVKKETVFKQLVKLSNAAIRNFDFRKSGIVQRGLNRRLELLSADLPLPEQFKKYSRHHVFGYTHLKTVAHSRSRVAADPDALAGKAAVSEFHKSIPFTDPRCKLFSVYDYVNKKNFQVKADIKDEKYHWYTIKNVEISNNTIFTAHLWMTQLNLSQAWEFPHTGDRRVNTYDVHFRAKFTGPAFVKDSKSPNAVYVDLVVLTRD